MGDVQTGSTKKNKGQLKREKILTFTRDRLIRDGYDAFVMREIAVKMEMTLGNLQYYFPTRESLLEAVIRLEAVTDLRDLQLSLASDGDEENQLANFVKVIITKWRGESGKIMSTMGFLALHKSSFRQIYKEVYSDFYEELTSLIRQIDPGQKTQNYLRKARLITALLDGASMQLQRGGTPDFLKDISSLALEIAKS